MSIPTKRKIRLEIKKLQKIQDASSDPILIRMAYLLAENLRWAIEDTEGWATPSDDVIANAGYLHEELSKGK